MPMNIEEKIESESRKLSDFYTPYYILNKHKKEIKTLRNVPDVEKLLWAPKIYTQYKDSFKKAASMFCVREGYDPKTLIDAFMIEGFQTPENLSNEAVWGRYKSYTAGKIQKESMKLFDAYFVAYFEDKYPGLYKQLSPEDITRHKNKLLYSGRGTRNKAYFDKAASMFSYRDEYNAEKFVQAAMLDGFKYPPQLCNEMLWKTYLSYLPGLSERKEDDREVVEEIVDAVMEIRRYGTMSDWISRKTTQMAIRENCLKIRPTLLAFSKMFVEYCDENGIEHYDFDSIKSRVAGIKSVEKVEKKIKEFLKEDCNIYTLDEVIF